MSGDTMIEGYKDRNFEKWMDLNLPSEADKYGRLMGALPRPTVAGSYLPLYRDVEEIIPYKDWPDLIKAFDESKSWMSELVQWICDQDGEGSCVSNAVIKMHEIRQMLQYGNIIKLSPVSVYRVCGSRPNSGSTLERNAYVMDKRGALPLNTPENKLRFKHTFPHNGFYTQYPDGFEETCSLFRNAEFFDIGSFEEFGSAILRGFPVMYARQGHCILGCRLFFRNGKVVLGYCNSWSLNWGDRMNDELSGGMGYDSENIMRYSANGAVGLRSVILPEKVWNFTLAS